MEALMRLAQLEARNAEQAGEVPVGAVVLAPDAATILSAGNNRVLRDADPTAHAEIVAMRSAARALGNYRLCGCILICTLEPCAMCAGAILHARLGHLIYAAQDPKAGACGSVLTVLNHPQLNHRLAVTAGILEAECSEQLSAFFRGRRVARSAE